MYILEPKGSDYPQPTSSIVNGGSVSLLGSIINKSHVQVVVVRGELPQEEFLRAINKSH